MTEPTDSNAIYRTLGSIEAKQDSLLLNFNTIASSFISLEQRVHTLERVQSRMIGYGFGFATITTIVSLIAVAKELGI